MVATVRTTPSGSIVAAARSNAVLYEPRRRLPEIPIRWIIKKVWFANSVVIKPPWARRLRGGGVFARIDAAFPCIGDVRRDFPKQGVSATRNLRHHVSGIGVTGRRRRHDRSPG